MRACSKCKIEKPLEAFGKCSAIKDGLMYQCKKCVNEANQIYRRNNPEKNKLRILKYINSEQGKKTRELWRKQNKEKLNEKERQKRKENPEYYKEINRRYRQKNKLKRKESVRKWKENNLDKHKEIQKRCRDKLRSTPEGKLNHRMNSLLRTSLKSKNGKTWELLVGYSLENLKTHLENKFTEGMAWEKLIVGEIEIDHIKPRLLFNYQSENDPEFKECWSLNNLQPLWKSDHKKKSAEECSKYKDIIRSKQLK